MLESNRVPKAQWIPLVLPFFRKGPLDVAINSTLNHGTENWSKFEALLMKTYEPANYH